MASASRDSACTRARSRSFSRGLARPRVTSRHLASPRATWQQALEYCEEQLLLSSDAAALVPAPARAISSAAPPPPSGSRRCAPAAPIPQPDPVPTLDKPQPRPESQPNSAQPWLQSRSVPAPTLAPRRRCSPRLSSPWSDMMQARALLRGAQARAPAAPARCSCSRTCSGTQPRVARSTARSSRALTLTPSSSPRPHPTACAVGTPTARRSSGATTPRSTSTSS